MKVWEQVWGMFGSVPKGFKPRRWSRPCIGPWGGRSKRKPGRFSPEVDNPKLCGKPREGVWPKEEKACGEEPTGDDQTRYYLHLHSSTGPLNVIKTQVMRSLNSGESYHSDKLVQ
ncbi:hypothetical protein L798_05987 [Zootermopsis nevadensis]|uniref:Uncharacterized protein n=1 Tax=Zootermopsis nevadensis TaxID=136037 RepID=A0A067RK10_ZOONE|nr:hypothetical protein L798_05987 [Zootermopsis nevadensis]